MDKMKLPNFGAVTGVGGTSGNDSKYFQTTKKGARRARGARGARNLMPGAFRCNR